MRYKIVIREEARNHRPPGRPAKCLFYALNKMLKGWTRGKRINGVGRITTMPWRDQVLSTAAARQAEGFVQSTGCFAGQVHSAQSGNSMMPPSGQRPADNC